MPAAAVPPEEMPENAAPSPCDAVRPLLSSLADGRATPDESAFASAHLAECEACASHYAFVRLTKSVLARQPAEFPSRSVSERIAAATYARPTFAERLRAFLVPAPNRYALGTALAAGLAAFFVSRVPLPVTPAPQGGEGARSVAVASPAPAVTEPAAPRVAEREVGNGRAAGTGAVASSAPSAAKPSSPAASAPAAPSVTRPEVSSVARAEVKSSTDRETRESRRSVTPDSGLERPTVAKPSAPTYAATGVPAVGPKRTGGSRGAAPAPVASKVSGRGSAIAAAPAGPDRSAAPSLPAPPSIGSRRGSGATIAAAEPAPSRPRVSAPTDTEPTVEPITRGSSTVASAEPTRPVVEDDNTRSSLASRLPAVARQGTRPSGGEVESPRMMTVAYRNSNDSYSGQDNSGRGQPFVALPMVTSGK